MSSALSTLNTTTEMPLSKAPNPQLFPGRRSINGCPLLRVCVHGVCVFTDVCVCTLDGLNAEHKFRVWVTILGCMSRHFTSLQKYCRGRGNTAIIWPFYSYSYSDTVISYDFCGSPILQRDYIELECLFGIEGVEKPIRISHEEDAPRLWHNFWVHTSVLQSWVGIPKRKI